MKISLATSLHLHHGAMSPDAAPGDRPPMQAFVPVGLLCLKAYLDENGLPTQTRVTELNGLVNDGTIPNDSDFFDRIADAILESDDDLVGLMTDADSLHLTLLIAEAVKRRQPETLVCLGGPASSPISRLILERFRTVDMVVRGEGELTLAEFVEAWPDPEALTRVQGLTWRSSGEIVENPDRPMMPDLDSLPMPAFDAYDMAAGADLYLDVGRGCPFKCEFCATAPFWDRRYRMKSIERILAEMVRMRDDYGRRHVAFSHDIFTANKRWVADFCHRLIAEDIGVGWSCSTRTDVITPQLLELMAAAGCEEMYFGIESGSPRLQHEISKDLDLDWSREIVSSAASAGIRPVFGFIIGYPTETQESLDETLTRYFEFLAAGGRRGYLFTLCPFHEAPMFKLHHDSIGRRARDYRLPLTGAANQRAERLVASHRDVFASLHRYDTLDLPAELIEGSEELSSALTLLRSLWPRLLSEYESPLDWYSRWVKWITRYNAERRPWTATPLQGTARDVLLFVDEELERLGLRESAVAELARYETLKMDAREKLAPGPVNGSRERSGAPLPESLIEPACDFFSGEFRYDVSAMLGGGDGGAPTQPGSRWVVFAKVEGETVDTIQTGPMAHEILKAGDWPARASMLVGTAVNGARPPEEGLALVNGLVDRGLLRVVA
jgi:radical SAM superfamily enzyme YgiQ (UPF0313 family)